MDSHHHERRLETEPGSADRILTAREVANNLKLTVTTVRSLAASGALPGFKIGKAWRFDKDEVLRRIAAATRGKNKV